MCSSTLLCAHSSKSPRPWDREAGTALVQTCSPPHVFPLQDEGRGLHLSLSHPIWLAINIWLQLDPIIRLIHRRGTCSVARMSMRERICIMYGHPPATHTHSSLVITQPLALTSAHTTYWHTNQLECNQTVSIFYFGTGEPGVRCPLLHTFQILYTYLTTNLCFIHWHAR